MHTENPAEKPPINGAGAGAHDPPPPPADADAESSRSPPFGTPNRGGRPKGAVDKRPRKRKNAAPAGAPKPPKPKKVADPGATFTAPTPGEHKATDGVGGTPEKPTVNVAAIVDPKELADALLTGGSQAISLVASLRYPEEWCKVLEMQPQEKEVLAPLLGAAFQQGGVNMSPSDAFLLIFGLMMGTKLLILEKELRKQRRSAGTVPSPLDERAPVAAEDARAA